MTNTRLTMAFQEWYAFICARRVDNFSLKKLFSNIRRRECGPLNVEARSPTTVIWSNEGKWQWEKETYNASIKKPISWAMYCFHPQRQHAHMHWRLSIEQLIRCKVGSRTGSRKLHNYSRIPTTYSLAFYRQVNRTLDRGFSVKNERKKDTSNSREFNEFVSAKRLYVALLEKLSKCTFRFRWTGRERRIKPNNLEIDGEHAACGAPQCDKIETFSARVNWLLEYNDWMSNGFVSCLISGSNDGNWMRVNMSMISK